MGKNIIVSNRLPLQIEVHNNTPKTSPSVGGLATGMKSVHQDGESLWVGWSGLTDESISDSLRPAIQKAIQKAGCAMVSLTEHEVENFYLGHSNKSIWPLFHYFLEFCQFDKDDWLVYKQANEKFAEVVLNHYQDGDVIWIHDYQLLLLPALLRKAIPNACIGFFLHIPFPSFEIFRVYPWREELLSGMLGADLVGVHTYDYERHFLSSVKRLLRHEVKYNEVYHDGRITRVDSFPMGIDYDKFHQAALAHAQQKEPEKSELQRRLDSHSISNKNSKLILAIDRLDYTKGIAGRIKAFEFFLNKYPQYKEKVRLVMLAVPSRSNVPQYKLLKKETDELVGRINGKFATVSWTPIWYFYRSLPFDNLIDLYTSSDVAMITPVRDGMNLVAKEYVATRTDQSGVLILSEMAGAAKELNKALLVNPSDTEALADALKTALDMPIGEQVSRNRSLQQRIRRYSVTRWAESFMQALLKAYEQREPHTAKKIGEVTLQEMTSQFEKAKKRLVFLDYDGTLSPFHDNPEMATPKDEVLNALEKIQSRPNTQLVIISGRDRDTLGTWFRNFPFVLVAEHGVFVRTADGIWSGSDQLRNDWMEHIRPVLQTFVDRTPGTFIEEKKHALAWHYRKTDPELAQNRVVELKTLLNSLITDNLKMLDGNKVIEIVHNKTNKGAAATQILSDWPADFVMAIGDDVTDEDMFIELPPESWTVKVGFQKTEASYCVSNTDEVAALLKTLAEAI